MKRFPVSKNPESEYREKTGKKEIGEKEREEVKSARGNKGNGSISTHDVSSRCN